MKKKILVLASVFMLSTSTGCNAAVTTAQISPIVDKIKAAVINFSDISQHWALEAINKAVQKGYVDGYEDGTFRPELNVTRAEFLKMAITAMKLSTTGDTTGSEWYKPYVAAATDKGILRSTDFPDVDINKPITRLEMARISVRATDVTFQNNAVQIDDKSVMYNATKTGLIQGLSYGELGPDKSTTRAQSVTIIERILTANSGSQLPVDKYAVSNAELELKKTNIFTVIPEIFGGKQLFFESYKLYNPANLVYETPDGKFKGAVDQIIAIDMADPNDPNRGLLGDINKMVWDPGTSKAEIPFVKNYPNSYIILFKTHVDENRDPDLYNNDMGITVLLQGFDDYDNQAKWKGVLNTATRVGPVPAGMQGYIIPSTGYKISSVVNIAIYAPARPPAPTYQKNILTVAPVKK